MVAYAQLDRAFDKRVVGKDRRDRQRNRFQELELLQKLEQDTYLEEYIREMALVPLDWASFDKLVVNCKLVEEVEHSSAFWVTLVDWKN